MSTSTFRSIEELVKVLNREQLLLKEMFAKRKSLSFGYDYAQELLEYKEDRIRFLINYGVIRENRAFLEMEDIYLKFLEEVLEVNEEINVSFVQEYISRLNNNIEYYLVESSERHKYDYQREVKRSLKNIALATVRNVVDLKRNMDYTYKTEPSYKIKKIKLSKLDEKRTNIALLIRKTEEIIDFQQPTFFKLAMDEQMKNVISDVKLQLNDSYHNLIEIQKQIINYLNLIEYQNNLFVKVRQLKYLKDQLILSETTDIRKAMSDKSPVWMEPQVGYRLKLSIDNLQNSSEAFEVIKKVMKRMTDPKKIPRLVAEAIPAECFDGQSEVMEMMNLQELKDKAEKLFSDRKKHEEVVSKLIDEMSRMGFIEIENEIDSTYKVTAAFHYIEELMDCITITEEVKNEIPE